MSRGEIQRAWIRMFRYKIQQHPKRFVMKNNWFSQYNSECHAENRFPDYRKNKIF